MLKLIKLESIKHKMTSYIKYSTVISVIMLGILYLFAYVPKIENDPELMIFLDYPHFIVMGSALNMFVFCTLSSIMASRLIIEAYFGEQAKLLFSYPICRKKILFAKLLYVFTLTAIAFTLSNLLIFSVFGLSDLYFSFMELSFTVEMFISVITNTLMMAVIMPMLGIVAVGVGFIKKSVPVTILSAVILSSIFCNIIFNVIGVKWGFAIILIFMLLTVIAAIITIASLKKRVEVMEV
ncbi:ABC-2 family transporter protein [compost metagenome]